MITPSSKYYLKKDSCHVIASHTSQRRFIICCETALMLRNFLIANIANLVVIFTFQSARWTLCQSEAPRGCTSQAWKGGCLRHHAGPVPAVQLVRFNRTTFLPPPKKNPQKNSRIVLQLAWEPCRSGGGVRG